MTTLAIHGGTPVRGQWLRYARQTVTPEDETAVLEALRSDWLTTGPALGKFEEALKDRCGAQHAVAVSSGTAAIHTSLAVTLAYAGRSNEVIVPAITFAATANAACYAGTRPIFADIRRDTLCVDPESVRERLTKRTAAVVAVDFAGQPADYEALYSLRLQFSLKRGQPFALIADASHSLGAAFGATVPCRVGSLADMTTFSFHPVKHITTGEGGAICTDSEGLARHLRNFRNHGLGTDTLGYNYRLSELGAALGRSQLGRLDENLKRRAELAERYRAAFLGWHTLTIPSVLAGVRHAWHLFPILLNLEALSTTRDKILEALAWENIGAVVHYRPVYLNPYYQRIGYAPGLCPNAEWAGGRLLSLPLFPAMSDQDADDVIEAVAKVLAYYAR